MSRSFLFGLLCLCICASTALGQTKLTKDNFEKVKAGKGTLTAPEVLKMLGAPQTVRRPSQFAADFDMVWEEAARIRIDFHKDEDKAVSLSGSFSDKVHSKAITIENFIKLRVGMPEKEIGNVLGSPMQGKIDPVTRNRIRIWEQSRYIMVSFKDGKVSGFIAVDSTAK